MSIPRETSTHFMMSRSAVRAADILDAWHENDRELLVKELAKGSALESAVGEDWHECERLELLDGIVIQIACSIASGQDPSVYIELLRHLATPGGPQTQYFLC